MSHLTPTGVPTRAPAALMAALYLLTVLATSLMPMAQAEAARGDRVLDLYYTHTKERKQFKFRKRGRYDQKVLKEMNYFLRDWRRSEPTRMDPALFDLVWEVYRDTRATGPIHVVSAYRSPATNKMLRSRSRGVAKNSQHTKGRAMDFFIPGMNMRKVRDAGLRKHVGGVGYYPRSNTPFVHLDTGSVRHWPRMSRRELAKVFPKGDTVHVPTDGKPFGGYNLALAQVEKRQRTAARFKPGRDEEEESESGGGLLALLGFGRKNDAPAAPANDRRRAAPQRAAPAPARVAEPRRDVLPPVPGSRPGGLPGATPTPAILDEPPILVAALPPAPRLRPRSPAAVAVAALGGANGLPAPVEDRVLPENDPSRASIVTLASLPRARPASPNVTLASLPAARARVPQGGDVDRVDPIARIAGHATDKIEDRVDPGTLPVAATAYAPAVSATQARAEAIIPISTPEPKVGARVDAAAPGQIAPSLLKHHKGPAYRQLLSADTVVTGQDLAWLAAPRMGADLLRGSMAAPARLGATVATPDTKSFSGSALR